MSVNIKDFASKSLRLGLAIFGGALIVAAALVFARQTSHRVHAAPIEPPEGHPKLNTSIKTVTPTLALPSGETLTYRIEIRNTGAYTAENVTLVDPLPAHTTYNNDAQASASPKPTFKQGTLTWHGNVGFDDTVIISFSVDVEAGYQGVISNTAVIDQALIDHPVEISAETLVTDQPKLMIEKTSAPAKPGPNKPLTYTLSVVNVGQPAVNLPITVVDEVPADTTFHSVGPDGDINQGEDTVTWTRNVTLTTGENSIFTFSVVVDDLPSGSVVSNDAYQVSSPGLGATTGEVYTTTVVDPVFLISKETRPHPPGSNREMTYTLSVLNKGSLATDLIITDTVPTNATYVRGGNFSNGLVTWNIDTLDTGESVQVSYVVYIGDVAQVFINNEDYGVCSAEGICEKGIPLNSLVRGPTFDTKIWLDPVAKKPGGGTGPVTPTIVIHNPGPGSALQASVLMYFKRISVSLNDLLAIPDDGQFHYGPECGEKCDAYLWVGDLLYGETITLTTLEGQSTIGGDPGTHYTATVVITDTLGPTTTEPFTTTRTGVITKTANLLPTKYAPPVVGAGQTMTYTIRVYNSGLSTDVPPSPWLTETVPLSTTLVNVSDEGETSQAGDRTVISWPLPSMGPGDVVQRWFSVQVDHDLVSGTEIINDLYQTSWYNEEVTGTLSNLGEPVTTVVKEIGLVDSFKTVEPAQVFPGKDNLITYTVHVVNSGPSYLSNIEVYDILPWEGSTYQRDAVASAGEIISDIVSVSWTGDLFPYSSELITLTVLVDEDFEGPLTNTATIQHPSLMEDVIVEAVAYVTDKPVLQITKSATPDPVMLGDELQYTIRVANLGQQATDLLVTDTLPVNGEYVIGSASSSDQLIGDILEWQIPVLDPGEVRYLSFQVKVTAGDEIVNEKYGVTSSEGVFATGPPLVTEVKRSATGVYLPMIFR